MCKPFDVIRYAIVSRGDGLEAPWSFKMTQWSCYWYGIDNDHVCTVVY